MRALSTLTILLLATLMMAQDQSHLRRYQRKIDVEHKAINKASPKSGITLFSEDFENGSNDWTTDVLNGSVEWTLTSTGNTSGFSPGPLESTSGFPIGSWMTADSDAQGAAGTQEETTFTSPAITDLSAYPALILEFEQSFRQLNDDETTVGISADGGITWIAYPVNTEVIGNQSTPGSPASQLISLNISEALNGGSSDIRIRFHWVSFEGFTYAWNIDDVRLIEAPENDLIIQSYTYSDWDPNTAYNFAGLEYAMYPVDQLRPLEFKTVVFNNGTIEQTGIHLHVNIDGPGSNDFSISSDTISLSVGTTDILTISGYSPPSVIGQYEITYSIVQDQVDIDTNTNIAFQIFQVTDHIFGRDLGNMDGGYDNQNQPFEIGNWFNMSNWGSDLHAIEVALNDQTDPGALIVAVLYDSNRDYLMESEEYIVVPDDLNSIGGDNFITLPLITPVNLQQNKDYLVVIKHYGGNDNVVLGTSGESLPFTSYILNGVNNTWYYITSTPMVRMNLDQSVSISERDNRIISDMTIYPNPATSTTNVQFELLRTSKVELQVLDAIGRVVLTEDLGTQGIGPVRVEINTTDLSSGFYSLTLNSSEGSVTSHLLVE